MIEGRRGAPGGRSRAPAPEPWKSGISTSTRQVGARAPDGRDRPGEDLGAAVGEIVAVDARHHHVLEPHLGDRRGPPDRARPSPPFGPAVCDRAEPQRRVHTSPRIMKVAVRSSQHSPMLGQRASSQTVWRFRSRIRRLQAHVVRPAGRTDLEPGRLARLDFRRASGWMTGSVGVIRGRTCVAGHYATAPRAAPPLKSQRGSAGAPSLPRTGE